MLPSRARKVALYAHTIGLRVKLSLLQFSIAVLSQRPDAQNLPLSLMIPELAVKSMTSQALDPISKTAAGHQFL